MSAALGECKMDGVDDDKLHTTVSEIAEAGETLGASSCVLCGVNGPGHDLSPALND